MTKGKTGIDKKEEIGKENKIDWQRERKRLTKRKKESDK